MRRPVLLVTRHLARCLSTSSSTLPTLGLRAEARARVWERRVPLTPTAVASLTRQGVKVLVQESEKRVFRDEEYADAGAEIVSNLDKANIILGVKEVAKEELKPDTTYAFFSHTHKGQAYNLPLLQAMLDSKSRFIDWELLTDDEGARTTAFGWLAGFSGMSDGLSLLGSKALALGSPSPLLHLPRPYMASSLATLQQSLRDVGAEISQFGTPRSLGPITIAVLGRGRVAQGAMAVLRELPVRWVNVEEMREIVEDPKSDLHCIYAIHVQPQDYLETKDGRPYVREHYYRSPADYTSKFDAEIAPWTTMLVNGAFWKSGAPPILSTAQLARVKKTASSTRMISVVDISCDFGGGLEFVTAPTTIDNPVIQLQPDSGLVSHDASIPGSVQVMSIEILPSALPLDSSAQFSAAILPYVQSLLHDPTSQGSDDSRARGLTRATLVNAGQLAPAHQELYQLLKSSPVGNHPEGHAGKKKRVLLLGSGHVATCARPAVKALTSRSDVYLTIASNELATAEALVEGSKTDRATAIHLDISDRTRLEKLVASSDVVLSLLPAPLHPEIARICIAHRTSMVTASYTSPEMASLHDEAKAAGVVLLNELGLDPGLDHCSAMQLIETAQNAGNEITSFVSFCGGLPSPESSNGPLAYKFSWSPRGVLTAASNPATFRVRGREVHIPGPKLLERKISPLPILKGLQLEGVANRNSLTYLSAYGLPPDLPTIVRGTLRYPSFIPAIDSFQKLGLLDPEVMADKLLSWDVLVDQVLGASSRMESQERRSMIAERLGSEACADEALAVLQSLALLPSSGPSAMNGLPSLPSSPQAPLDLMSRVLAHKLKYGPQERDAVILHHELGTMNPTTGKPELYTSTLVQYGVPGGDSAMATTVGLPLALGGLLVLDGAITGRGVVSPSSPEVWRPLLASLEEHGINMVEGKQEGVVGLEEDLSLSFGGNQD